MNGTEPKIEIFKPFGEAFDLMKKILFQPFDLKKWCVIGFTAFLANLGGGFNFNYNPGGDAADRAELKNLYGQLHEIPTWIWIAGGSVLVLLILAIVIVFAWLRARGRFMFIDCIVKNRGAVVAPWREFKKEGNSFFLFSLLISLGIFIFALLLGLPILVPIFRGTTFQDSNNVYLISVIVLWAIIIFLLAIGWALIGQLMVPVMYRRRCRAMDAMRAAFSAIARHPGEITLYCLFWIVLALAALVVACLSTCATCCLTIIPYVGTVILLPLFVSLTGFNLHFIRQFGPDYDVWEGIIPPEQSEPPPVTPPPLSPPDEPAT